MVFSVVGALSQRDRFIKAHRGEDTAPTGDWFLMSAGINLSENKKRNPAIPMKRSLSHIVLILSALLLADEANAQGNAQLRSDMPPGALKPQAVPQFVSLGFDDANDAAGVEWILQMLAKFKNPSGGAQLATFDGTKVRATFFPNCGHVRQVPSIVSDWRNIHIQGHEIGNHTLDHNSGEQFTEAQWREQLEGCMEVLTKTQRSKAGGNVLGMNRLAIKGLRAPYLMYNDNAFKAARKLGLHYDVSVQEGLQKDRNGKNQFWPYTMDQGLEAAKYAFWQPKIDKHSGFWVLPLHVLSVVPDDKLNQYGLNSSLSTKLKKQLAGLNTHTDKLTPFDHNLYSSDKWMYALNKAEALAVLKYNLDLRLASNRAPMVLGFHTAYLNGQAIEGLNNTSPKERQEVVEAFLTYALSKPQVRVVRHIDVINWMRKPVSLLADE